LVLSSQHCPYTVNWGVKLSYIFHISQEVHDFFKRNFKFLATDTVEHSDGVQRCIRVRLKSGPRGRRNFREKARNRTGMGSSGPSGWRDDRPFDSRVSVIWPYHLGKYLR
jgi:tRNA pseudouridine13 synthase